MRPGRSLGLLLPLALSSACRTGESPTVNPDPRPDPAGDAPIFVDVADLGSAVPGLGPDTQAAFDRGREVMARAFQPEQGLGPTFNTDSCAGCHQFPVPGGSAPRYRDFWLVKAERWDGTLEDAGSNGISPVRNLYRTHPPGHVAEAEGAVVYARRNAPSGFGIGLFEFVPDDVILANEDPDDLDGDGISGRANYEQGRVGRFGYKSQASSMESFNRGAMLNQMGLTSNPLFHEFAENVEQTASWRPAGSDLLDLLGGVAHAQVSAPGQPTFDEDQAADPELSDRDQLDLLIFSTFLAAPRPTLPLTAAADRGATLFDDLGCAACHIPRLESRIGPLAAYTDLLLHDMGEERADGIGPGFAKGNEFRTAPLWGVVLHAPFLHDGAADTLDEATRLHGGEGAASRDAYLDLSSTDQQAVIAFLEALGGRNPEGRHFTAFEAAAPQAGEPGGPVSGLSEADLQRWLAGRGLFDHDSTEDDGLGTDFNADSCRACHQDPVIGGAGGIDTNVIRFGSWDGDGHYTALERPVLPRVTLPGRVPFRLPAEANTVELRQPPTVLGVGRIDAISDAAIEANADPEDEDGDGISGRARRLADGRLGRYGWKAQVPTVLDFVADALLNENGVTIEPDLSGFTVIDDGDSILDPEQAEDDTQLLAFFLLKLEAPQRAEAEDAAQAAQGEALFAELGCASCHLPSLDGVPLYSDLLLHEVCPPDLPVVDQEPGVSPGEFRTPPLWGLRDTAPYLHDGEASTIADAIERGHDGEAAASRSAWRALTEAESAALDAFLRTL